MLAECMVKQFVGVVHGKHGNFNVYETGDPHYYLFKPVVNGVESVMDIPILKQDLLDEIKWCLKHGLVYEGGGKA